jgi:hypothetical protein
MYCSLGDQHTNGDVITIEFQWSCTFTDEIVQVIPCLAQFHGIRIPALQYVRSQAIALTTSLPWSLAGGVLS